MDINTKVELNNGIKIQLLGLGTYQTKIGKETEQAVLAALEIGYRHIDTAAYYRNEKDVGNAVKKSELLREEIFITTKLRNEDHSNPAKALETSLKNLGMDYVDLYLIHWPVEKLRKETWKQMVKLYDAGKCKAIGVSNYTISHLRELISETNTLPVVNQVEFSPYLYQKELLDYCVEEDVQVEAYSPLTRGEKLSDPKLVEIAKKYGKTTAQILIRWSLQHDLVVLPKSKTSERIKENADVFNFEISPEDMEKMNNFNENFRTCWDPTSVP